MRSEKTYAYRRGSTASSAFPAASSSLPCRAESLRILVNNSSASRWFCAPNVWKLPPSARFVYDSLRLQLASKLASGVFTSNSARPILSKRFLAWFISGSAPWTLSL